MPSYYAMKWFWLNQNCSICEHNNQSVRRAEMKWRREFDGYHLKPALKCE